MTFIKSCELWAEELFSGSDLGDKRRTKRLIKLASSLSSQVGKSESAVSAGDDSAIEGNYRLIRNEKITPEAISEGAFKSVAKQARERELLLAIEDTTTIGYRHGVVDELGDLGGPSNGHKKGFFAHSILLVDACKKQTLGFALSMGVGEHDAGCVAYKL